MAAAIAIDGVNTVRVDDRLSTIGNSAFIEVAPDVQVLPPTSPRKYGTLLIGLTSSGDINGPLIMEAVEVWNFGVHRHRSMIFPDGIPPGYENILWDCWFVPYRRVFTLLVAGINE